MSKVVRIIALCCSAGYFLVLAPLTTSKCQSTQTGNDVSIRICAPDGAASRELGSTVIVLLSNGTQSPIVIDRHLSGTPLRNHNSLWVWLKDAKSGEPVRLRSLFRPIQRVWRESDLMELGPGLNYGPVVNLGGYFALQRGKRYICNFRYGALAPKVVGRLRPWAGIARSRDIEIRY